MADWIWKDLDSILSVVHKLLSLGASKLALSFKNKLEELGSLEDVSITNEAIFDSHRFAFVADSIRRVKDRFEPDQLK